MTEHEPKLRSGLMHMDTGSVNHRLRKAMNTRSPKLDAASIYVSGPRVSSNWFGSAGIENKNHIDTRLKNRVL
jgi:hypothetical protein